MSENGMDELIEQIAVILMNLVSDSEDLKVVLDKLRDEGHEPHISIEARLSFSQEEEVEVTEDEDAEMDESVFTFSEKDIDTKKLFPADINKKFDELITPQDSKFLDSINIRLKK